MAGDDMEKILPLLRREVSRALDASHFVGEETIVQARDGCELHAWYYAAPHPQAPTLFEIHGGGFAMGDARRDDALRARVRDRYDINVVGIDYRLAPEHPFPCALHDVEDTLAHFAARAEELSLNVDAFYLMGYSAGATLAAASCLDPHAPWRDGAAHALAVRGLILHYPFLDATKKIENSGEGDEQYADIPVELMRAFVRWYATDADLRSPLISPAMATIEQLQGFPDVRSYPVVGDTLFEECERFHGKLRAAGVRESLTPIEGAYHGYIEDAANREVYEATAFPETRAQRPADYEAKAHRALSDGLDAFFG